MAKAFFYFLPAVLCSYLSLETQRVHGVVCGWHSPTQTESPLKGNNDTSKRKFVVWCQYFSSYICLSKSQKMKRCDPRCELSLCAGKTAVERRITLDGTNTMKYDRAHREERLRGQKRTGQPQLRRLYANRHWSETGATITRVEPLWHRQQRVPCCLQEIKDRPRISVCLAVFSVHTSKVAYQRSGQPWSYIICQSLKISHRAGFVVAECVFVLSLNCWLHPVWPSRSRAHFHVGKLTQ